MWTPTKPADFAKFTPFDIPAFLQWWELQQSNLLALEFTGAFVEGAASPWLEILAKNQPTPPWLETLLRYRLLAQWAYQAGLPIAAKLRQGLEPLAIPSTNYTITPEDIAEVPPAVRQSFQEGIQFSMNWIDRLSTDARELMGDLLSVNALKNRSPNDAIPALERILRRDRVAKELGIKPGDVMPEQLQAWLNKAQFTVLEAIATRAEAIAQTESMRMMNLGILSSMEGKGDRYCYVMPHRGTCPKCQELLDGRVFEIAVLKENLFKNFGLPQAQWVASLPQHVKCRHHPMSVPYKFRKAIKGAKVPREGLLLQWYGLPGGQEAMESLGLPQKEWLVL